MKNNSLASQEMKGNSEKETVNISSYKLHLCCKTSMKKRKMKWRGKTDSNFLVYAYFICKYASMIAGMLRDMTKNTPCIFHNCISSQRLPYLIQFYEHTIVNLLQPEQLQHLTHLGGHLIDTERQRNYFSVTVHMKLYRQHIPLPFTG